MNTKVSKGLSFFIVFTLILTNLFSFGIPNVAEAEGETYVETFENFNETGGQYVNGSFVGENNIKWNYELARKDEGYKIDGKGLMLGKSDSKCTSDPIPGGISSFSVELKKAFTGKGNRQVELFINGESKGKSQAFDDEDIHSFSVDDINIGGDIVIEIRNATGKQITIDNISWASYEDGGSGEDPDEKVASVTATPPPGSVDEGTEVILSTSTEEASVYYAVYTDDNIDPEYEVFDDNNPIVVDEALTIKAFAAKDGLENSDVEEFKYTIKVPAALQPISEAKQKDVGTEIIVQGIVTGLIGNNAFIQDETAGLYLYNGPNKIDELSVGNIVKVKGIVDEFNNLRQIKNVEILELVSSGNELPAPKIVTIPEITEEYESQLVKLEKLTLKTIPESGSNNFSIVATDGKNDIDIRVDKYLDPPISLPLENLNVGDQVDVTAPVGQFMNKYQLMIRTIDDIVRVWEGEDEIPPTITHTPITKGHITKDLTITTTVTDDRQVEAVKLYYRTKGAEDYTIVDMAKGEDAYTYTIPKAGLTTAGIEYYIEASDGTNTATSPEDMSTPYEVTISDEDITPPVVTNLTPASGASTGENFKPVISAEYSDPSGINIESIKLYLDGIDVTGSAEITEAKITYNPSTELEEGNHIVRLEVSDKSPTPQTSIVEWNFYAGEKKYNFYFGQLHSHTNISDGSGSLDDAYTWARDKGNADFFAVTDHSNWFDNEDDTSNENITDISQSTSEKWKIMNSTADSYDKDGEFIAIAGFEMTWSGSTGGWGHINTFNTPWFASRSNSKMDLPAYYEHISADTDSISQLNHPGKTFGDFADFGYYSGAADSVVHLIEVGNGEGPIRGSGYFPSYEYYTRALDKGWHVAPSNNQDNHKGNWITSNEARTVVLAPELTRESIFDAIRALSVYSTEDSNLEIMYTVNNEIMGASLDEPDSLSINIQVNDPDETDVIGKISIISNGGVVVESKEFDDNTAVWNLEIDPEYNYYYVRVDQVDKDIAVTAPVWTSEVEAIGISKVEVSQEPVIVGEEFELSAEVYNNGKDSINDIIVEFYENEIEEANKIGETTILEIEAGKTEIAKVNWIPDRSRTYTIYAKATVNIDGIDKVFTQSRKVLSGNEEDFVRVLVDGGHSNQYVTGNYAGKIETLKEMMKERSHILNINMDELTAEDLEGVSLLIITDPQGTDNPEYNEVKSNYTSDEIQVIKEFVEKGGSIIVTSRADYKDGTGEYSNSAQLTPILEAVETNLRVNDDQLVDNVSNGGQPYRLYFDQYVSSKYDLTKNIPEGTTYSFYSGCSVILKEDGNDENVDWLVKGHDTTETSDADNVGDNIPVEKGNVYALAAEELPNGAKVVVAGTTFFSDFETASSDNQYSNKKIMENILSWIIQPEEVELKTVAEVRVDEDKDSVPDLLGKRFTVEGRVTAQSEAVTPKNAFFEVIYVQDETGGITVFGVSATPLPLGTKVRITGVVDQYLGDAELSVENELKDIVIIDDSIVLVEPKEMTTGDSMLEENEGWLVKVQGKVTRMTGNSLYIDDGTGEARVYVEGYIGDGTGNSETKGKWDPAIKIGDRVSAIGLASEDPEGHRLRVRNTAEIVKLGEISYPISIQSVKTSDFNGNPSIEFEKGNVVIVDAGVTNTTQEAVRGTVIIKLVDSEDRTYAIGFINGVELGVEELKTLSMGFKVNGVSQGKHTAKVYMWNNLTDKAPLSEVGTVEFTVK